MQEALRIQNKFSRYDANSLCSKINSSHLYGDQNSVEIDAETFQLLDYANSCYQISHGLFDITSGILRKVWRFDGTANIPTENMIKPLLKSIGWDKVKYDRKQITLPLGMEIDFGGIAKEYAVDTTAIILTKYLSSKSSRPTSFLINFGGDLYSNTKRANGKVWNIGIEQPRTNSKPSTSISIHQGAIATSGDSRRFHLKDDIRYGHILDPRNGWPIENAPASITVAAPTCITAGMLATMALLQGSEAESFLAQQAVEFWIKP